MQPSRKSLSGTPCSIFLSVIKNIHATMQATQAIETANDIVSEDTIFSIYFLGKSCKLLGALMTEDNCNPRSTQKAKHAEQGIVCNFVLYLERFAYRLMGLPCFVNPLHSLSTGLSMVGHIFSMMAASMDFTQVLSCPTQRYSSLQNGFVY